MLLLLFFLCRLPSAILSIRFRDRLAFDVYERLLLVVLNYLRHFSSQIGDLDVLQNLLSSRLILTTTASFAHIYHKLCIISGFGIGTAESFIRDILERSKECRRDPVVVKGFHHLLI